MKRLRATIDVYVDMDKKLEEVEALEEVNMLIDCINNPNKDDFHNISVSEIIQFEIYNEEEED